MPGVFAAVRTVQLSSRFTMGNRKNPEMGRSKKTMEKPRIFKEKLSGTSA